MSLIKIEFLSTIYLKNVKNRHLALNNMFSFIQNSSAFLWHSNLFFSILSWLVLAVVVVVVVPGLVVGGLQPLEEDVQHRDVLQGVADGCAPGLAPLAARRRRHKASGLIILAKVVVVVVVLDVVVMLNDVFVGLLAEKNETFMKNNKRYTCNIQ